MNIWQQHVLNATVVLRPKQAKQNEWQTFPMHGFENTIFAETVLGRAIIYLFSFKRWTFRAPDKMQM